MHFRRAVLRCATDSNLEYKPARNENTYMMKTKTPTIEAPGKTKQQRPGASAASEAAAEPEIVGGLAEVRPRSLSTNGHGKAKRIAVIPGDGIGKEVIPEAVKVLQAAAQAGSREVKLTEFDWGADRYLRDGVTLPADAVEMFHRDFDAILLGAMGDPGCRPTCTRRIFCWGCGSSWICT